VEPSTPETFDEKGFHLFGTATHVDIFLFVTLGKVQINKSSATAHPGGVGAKLRKSPQTFIFNKVPLLR